MTLYDFDKNIEKETGRIVIGTDEAGRGPLAGPVVAASVKLDLSNPIEGLNDSKKLSAKKRDLLYDEIIEKAISWSVSLGTPDEIDQINILQSSLLSMYRSSQDLNCKWNLILVDGNKTIPQLNLETQRTIIKGDSKSASIAAASIVAKVTRDRIMEKYHKTYPEYNFESHKGYPTKAHIEVIGKIGITPIHRRSFCEKFITQVALEF